MREPDRTSQIVSEAKEEIGKAIRESMSHFLFEPVTPECALAIECSIRTTVRKLQQEPIDIKMVEEDGEFRADISMKDMIRLLTSNSINQSDPVLLAATQTAWRDGWPRQ